MTTLQRTAAAVLCALLAGGFVLHTRAAPRQVFVIEVSEAGFNPPSCKLSRGDSVVFRNVGSALRRVIWADPGGGAPLYDSGELAPGEDSHDFSGFEFPSRWIFRDTHNTSLSVVVITPTLSNSWEPDCAPDPALRPAQGIPPHDCAAAAACVRMASLAADGTR